MPKEAYTGLLQLEKGNAIIIANYLMAYKAENDVEDSTRLIIIVISDVLHEK